VQKYLNLKSKLIQCYYFYITFVFGFPNLVRLSTQYTVWRSFEYSVYRMKVFWVLSIPCEGFSNLLPVSTQYTVWRFFHKRVFYTVLFVWTDLNLFWFTYPILLLGNQPFSFQDEVLCFSFNQILFYHIKQKSVVFFRHWKSVLFLKILPKMFRWKLQSQMITFSAFWSRYLFL